MNKRILIGCPVRDRELYLPYYLEHIYNIKYDKKLIDIYWIINNSTDKSYDLLKEFKDKYKDEYNSITIEVYNNRKYPKDERTVQVREKIYYWLSELRNKLLKKCIDLNCDYLFSCDSDILIPNDILTRLLCHEKDLISSLIYNGYLYKPSNENSDYNPILNAYKFPNILKLENNTYKHIVNYKTKNPNLNPINTLTEVDFTGAVFLATQNICKDSYYEYHIQGEDEVFSRIAIQKGYKLYCDLSLYSQHLMNENILEMYLNGELTFANGEVIKIN
jgi:hypothetical protein